MVKAGSEEHATVLVASVRISLSRGEAVAAVVSGSGFDVGRGGAFVVDTGNEVFLIDSQPAQRQSRRTTAGPWGYRPRGLRVGPFCRPCLRSLASCRSGMVSAKLIANEQTEAGNLSPRLQPSAFPCVLEGTSSSGAGQAACGPKRKASRIATARHTRWRLGPDACVRYSPRTRRRHWSANRHRRRR